MLGEFIVKILALVLGYLYPAFECFRTMEHSRVNAEHLLFWCQYWVIMAVLISIENFGDIFISWLPLYGECKLLFIVYLWHPRFKGTIYIYNTFLRPFIINNETDIEMRMRQIMEKSGDLLLFYFNNFVDKGHSLAFEILQYVFSRRGRYPPPPNERVRRPSVPPPSEEQRNRRRSSPSPTWPPSAPPLEQQPPRGPSSPYTGSPTRTYQSVNPVDDHQPEVNHVEQVNHGEGANPVEEALRRAGVNLPGLHRRSV